MKRVIVLCCFVLTLAGLCMPSAGGEGAEALWPAYDEETRLWGYINESGVWCIAPQYHDAGRFYGGCAVVSMEEEPAPAEGIIDMTGMFLLPPEYFVFDGFAEDVFFVMDGSYDENDEDMGWFYIPGRYFTGLHWYECVACSDGPYVTVAAGNPRRSGLADRATGEIVLPLEYTITGLYELQAEGGFVVAERADTGECELIEPGAGRVELPEGVVIDYYPGVCEGLIPFEQDGQWGYLNTAGEIVIPAQYRYADGFCNGYANVGTWDAENTTAVIDRAGKVFTTIAGDDWNVGCCGMAGDMLHIGWPEDEWGLVRPDGTELCRFSDPEGWLVQVYAPTEDGPLWVLEDLADGERAWHLLSREDWTLTAPGWKTYWWEGPPAVLTPVEAAPAQWRYVDAYGQTIIDGVQALDAWPFEGALARIVFNECSEGWINRSGEIVYRWTYMDDSD